MPDDSGTRPAGYAAAAAVPPRPADASRGRPLPCEGAKGAGAAAADRGPRARLGCGLARVLRRPAAAAASPRALRAPGRLRGGGGGRSHASDWRGRRPATEHAQRAGRLAAVCESPEARVGARRPGRVGGPSGGVGWAGDPGAPAHREPQVCGAYTPPGVRDCSRDGFPVWRKCG